MSTEPPLPTRDPKTVLSSLLTLTETRIVPLTARGVSSGSKLFGAAILSSSSDALDPYTVSTNDERTSPLLHGEINCIQTFFTRDFPDPATRPSPRTDCVFFATHEPCSLCLSGIAWSGFREVYYLFTYEDSRDLFAIPHDINILQQVFRVPAEGEDETTSIMSTIYEASSHCEVWNDRSQPSACRENLIPAGRVQAVGETSATAREGIAAASINVAWHTALAAGRKRGGPNSQAGRTTRGRGPYQRQQDPAP
ncbi:cytidine and deoxycytidylate deaminase zinc-binding region [Colletotrichum simmondsii]|uniref:Cytidine and deoxycytidylate deaminase zinc-binding region n=1 Tax=Colletotrichum simmondsii TaxID=703756 RepID=A0A135SUJ7_9PEZI|nr:cytidine and deoxycytidylate deaminase zinc-binding region [Colletotrichum simmondsii]